MPHYWTEFTFRPESLAAKLHCTHKFLGEQPPESIERIQRHLHEHFATYVGKLLGEYRPPEITFDLVKWFGVENNVRVLVPSIPHLKLFPRLRNLLNCYRTDENPYYEPHVTTTNFTSVGPPFYSYALRCSDNKSVPLFEHKFG